MNNFIFSNFTIAKSTKIYQQSSLGNLKLKIVLIFYADLDSLSPRQTVRAIFPHTAFSINIRHKAFADRLPEVL